jgi:membrane protein
MAGKLITTWENRFSSIKEKTKQWWYKVFCKLPGPLKNFLLALKNSVTLFRSHDTASLGSGLSYYMVFSIAPLLMIVISVTGAILGPKTVTGELGRQLQSLLGSSTANEIQAMIKTAYQPGKNWIATAISFALLTTGAIGVFDQLRSSLNMIWDVKPVEKKPFWTYLANRLFSFGMIACIAFLLLVSLVINAGLAALSGIIGQHFHSLSKVLIGILELIISFSLTTFLFAFIYKYMSDIKMQWKNVWYGAIFTSLLFAIGKYIIGIYISKSNIANTYGAASSVIIILLWVYYSSQIVFFGAEFTRGLAEERGIHIEGIGAPPPPKP